MLIISSSCKKDKSIPCPNLQTAYSFQVTSQWVAEREIYSIGDTIFLSSLFPKKFTDPINPSMIIDYKNSVGISGLIGLVFLDSLNRQFIPATDSFRFVDIEGRFVESRINQNRTKSIAFVELSDNYKFVGGIICMKKGIYEIDVDNLYSAGIRDTKCTSANFIMSVSNGNKHINLYQSAINQVPTSGREKIMYCFRVQ